MKKLSLHQLQKALGEVNVLFSRGNIEAAEKILNELVSFFQSHPEVLSKLGTIYLYQDKLNDGIQVIKKSLEVNPYQPEALNNYAVALLNSDRAKEAIEVINKAIKLKPDYIDAYYHQGIIFKSLGLLDEALKAYQNALKFSPVHENAILNSAALYIQLEKYNEAISFLNNFQLSIRSPGYFYNLGLAHLKIKNFIEAQQFFNSALSLNPNYCEALNNLGLSLKGLGRYEEALEPIDKALALDNQNIETYKNKGLILIELERFEEAISQFQIAIKIKSDDFTSYNNLGIAFKGLGLFDDALKNYNLALGLKADYAEVYVNRGLLFKNQHLYEQAFQDIKYASDLDPSNLDINDNLSMIYLLVQLNFKDGWQSFERRKEVYEFKEKTRSLNKIYLDRLPDSDDPILICNEQGVGDQIIYLSLLHELEILPNKIYIKIDARLLPLFQRSFTKFIFLSNKESLDSNRYKYHMLCGSLPHIYRNSKDSFLNQRGSFLIADQSRTASLRKTLTSTHKYVCGIAWKSVNPKFGHFKSMALKNLLPILKLPFINFINLQYGDISKEIDLFNNEHGTNINKIDEIDNFNDIDGLASLIDACDFIVTISNVTAHIAGALGKKVFLLVPDEQGRIWYWHENLTKSLWYPSIEIFSQNETGDWSVPINQIKEKIVKEIAHE